MSTEPCAQLLPAREPPRIKRFRLEIANAIPRVPNNRASLLHMRQKRLTDILIDYVAWRSRYVGIRPRTIAVDPADRKSRLWSSHLVAINAFLDKARRGEDLTPYLSIQPHTRGYALAANTPGASSEERWSDKDFLLNTMNYHHFHLEEAARNGGHGQGKDELIFAEVNRDTFKLIAVFGHKVFEQGSSERQRLRRLHDTIAARSAPQDAIVMGSTAIATSGHTLHSVRYAQRCAQLIEETDPKIDAREQVEGWFGQTGVVAPGKPKFEWTFDHLDLGILEKKTGTMFWLQKGWN